MEKVVETVVDDEGNSTTTSKIVESKDADEKYMEETIVYTQGGIVTTTNLSAFKIDDKYIGVHVATIKITCDDITSADVDSIINFYQTNGLTEVTVIGGGSDALECSIAGWAKSKTGAGVVFKKN